MSEPFFLLFIYLCIYVFIYLFIYLFIRSYFQPGETVLSIFPWYARNIMMGDFVHLTILVPYSRFLQWKQVILVLPHEILPFDTELGHLKSTLLIWKTFNLNHPKGDYRFPAE